MSIFIGKESIKAIGDILNDSKAPLNDRFRALFTLRNLGGPESIDAIAMCFQDPSVLLKHELGYCLGQMQDKHAIPALVKVLGDVSQEPMVRHEAGEALGAIGGSEALEALKKYCSDPVVEVAETCQLAVGKLELESKAEEDLSSLPANPYKTVDPAPPAPLADVPTLRSVLLDESLPLFERYRTMFTLRNMGTTEAVLALAEGLKCSSALFRHEIAYVLGQVQSPACIQQLAANLRDEDENSMVRHECAEALGSIATDECTEILKPYLHDPERVVKESCLVALDITEHEHSGQLQYANTLSKVSPHVG